MTPCGRAEQPGQLAASPAAPGAAGAAPAPARADTAAPAPGPSSAQAPAQPTALPFLSHWQSQQGFLTCRTVAQPQAEPCRPQKCLQNQSAASAPMERTGRSSGAVPALVGLGVRSGNVPSTGTTAAISDNVNYQIQHQLL